MNFTAYENYSPISTNWLESFPSQWNPTRIKHVAPFQVGWTPPTKNDEYFEGENLWANISDLKSDLIFSTSKQISDKAVMAASMAISPKGSLLYSFKLSVGTVAFAGADMYTNEAIATFLPHGKLPLGFLFYALPVFVIHNAATNIYGARILNQDLIRNAFLLQPPTDEAEQIAAFLDYETAKIDALIEKQQQLIALLGEKRQAVISHAVTKGLNPDAPMRDSGVEWLGQVPEHWKVLRLGHVARVFNGSTPSRDIPRYWVDEGIPWLSSGKVNEQVVLEPSEWIAKSALNECSIEFAPKGSVIIGMIGQGATRAMCSVLGIDTTINQNMAALVPSGMLDSTFLYHFMTAAYEDLRLLGRGANQPALNCEILKSYKIALPPLDEQAEISSRLDRSVETTNRAILLAESQRDLLQERRTALISAAVTGKIDVRGWKRPTADRQLEAEMKLA